MRDFLLDTNIITVLVTGARRGDQRLPFVKSRFENAKHCKFYIPIMSVCEIETGLSMGESSPLSAAAQSEIASLRRFLSRFPKVNINSDCVRPYSRIRAKVFALNAKRKTSNRGYSVKKTHEITDRISDISLGIDERDLLIVAAAVQKNLTLATMDSNSEMKLIIDAVRALEREDNQLRLYDDYWDLPPIG